MYLSYFLNAALETVKFKLFNFFDSVAELRLEAVIFEVKVEQKEPRSFAKVTLQE